jgi:hypothetical protein
MDVLARSLLIVHGLVHRRLRAESRSSVLPHPHLLETYSSRDRYDDQERPLHCRYKVGIDTLRWRRILVFVKTAA